MAGALPVADYLFEAIPGAGDMADPRVRSRALSALAPTVAAMADPVVRAHYVQRLARIGRVDERQAAQLVAQARRGRVRLVESGERSPLAPRAGGGRRAAAARAPGLDGEAQLLRLLLANEACREAGEALDADLFEDSGNRALYEAWREHPGLASEPGELEEETRQRVDALLARALPPIPQEELQAMVGEIASRLRERRRQARLRARTTEVAEELVAARRTGGHGGAGEPEGDGLERTADNGDPATGGEQDGSAPPAPVEELAAELEELVASQRRLAQGAGVEMAEAGAMGDGGSTRVTQTYEPAGMEELLEKGRRSGQVTAEDVLVAFPQAETSRERLSSVIAQLSENGISVRIDSSAGREASSVVDAARRIVEDAAGIDDPVRMLPARDRQGRAAHGRRREAPLPAHRGVAPRRGDRRRLRGEARAPAPLRRDPRRAPAPALSGAPHLPGGRAQPGPPAAGDLRAHRPSPRSAPRSTATSTRRCSRS